MRRPPLILILILLLPILLTGLLYWYSLPHQTAQGGRTADFTFINRGEIGTLDPNRMSWLQDIRIGYALWEGLYTLDPATLEPVPGVADRIEISDDKTVYTFHIRPTARWTNGDAVTAADFVFAWRRMLEEPGDYTYLLHYIHGAQAYEYAFIANNKPDFRAVGIETPDAMTLRVKLDHPVTFFPELCAFPPLFPLHEKSMKPFEQIDPASGRRSYTGDFILPPNLVTNGPYKLDTWRRKQLLRLVASEFYWDRANVKSKIIDQVSAEEGLNAFLKYDGGEVDWMAEVGEIAPELREVHRKDIHVFPGFGTYFYTINCRPEVSKGRANPFADVRVRQAFAMAVDKKPIVDNITRMGETVAATYIPPGIFPGYRSPKGLEYNIPAARKLLAEAGYPGGKGFPSVSILYNAEFQHGPIAQVIRKQWMNNLGVRVELEGVEIKTFRERLHNKDYVIARASWYGDYVDPSTFTDKYLANSGNNDSDWINPRFDELCQKAVSEPDPARRLRLLEEAENLICNEVPIIPIYFPVNTYCFRDNVKGIALNPRNMVMFKSIQVKR